MNTTQLITAYFDMWSTTDDSRRHELAQQIFAPDAMQYVFKNPLPLKSASSPRKQLALGLAGLLAERGGLEQGQGLAAGSVLHSPLIFLP